MDPDPKVPNLTFYVPINVPPPIEPLPPKLGLFSPFPRLEYDPRKMKFEDGILPLLVLYVVVLRLPLSFLKPSIFECTAQGLLFRPFGL